MTWNKFHSEGSQLLDANAQKFIRLGNLWPEIFILLYITVLCDLYYKNDLLHEERITRDL